MQGNFEQIVRTYGSMVLRLAMTNVGNKADAEDVFQEVFIRLVRSMDKIENEDHLKHWLIRATCNRCKSHFGSAQKKRELLVDNFPERADKSVEEEGETPATDALRDLPEKYRIPIHLYYFEGFSIIEIARLLESNEGTIKSQLSRGRKMLNESLKEVSSYV